jgi:hypothetical protein
MSINPNYGKIKNDINYARNTPNKGILFKYKEECKNANVVWGSNKPIAQKCLPTKLQMSGEPCNNIWNNSTKRKTIVNVKYSYPR